MRWLLAAIGLAIGLGALYALLGVAPGAPLDDIDAASRAQLERVIREADERGSAR